MEAKGNKTINSSEENKIAKVDASFEMVILANNQEKENNENKKETPMNEDEYSFVIDLISLKKTLKCSIIIKNNEVKILTNENKTEIVIINFRDLLGVKLFSELNSKTTEYYKISDPNTFCLFYYPKIVIKRLCVCCTASNCCKSEEIRQMRTLHFLVNPDYSDELLNILHIISYKGNYLKGEIALKRNYIVFVNPIGGSGKALKIWNEVKQEFFDKTYIEINLIKTTHYKHAYEYVLGMNFNGIHGILSVSGDGIVHEVINAIKHRSDANSIKIPIGHIPAGGGNGLAKSICLYSKEQFNKEVSTFLTCKGEFKAMDIMEIEFASMSKPVYSFHSLSWGYVSDVGLESEVIRCCGGMRFDTCALWLLLSLCSRKHYAAIYHLRKDSPLFNSDLSGIPSLKAGELDNNFERINQQICFVWLHNIPWLTNKIHSAPETKFDDGQFDSFIYTGGKCTLLKFLSNQDLSQHFTSDGILNPNLSTMYRQSNVFRLYPKFNLSDPDAVDENKTFPKFYNIDGERYKVEPIQIKVKKESLNVFCFSS